MTKDKYDILDFFFDGDMLITEPHEYKNINKVLTRGNYMFSTSEKESSLENFFVHTLSRQEGDNFYYITLRIPNGKRNIQEEVKELVEIQKLIGFQNCTWAIIEDIYCQTDICAGILIDTTS